MIIANETSHEETLVIHPEPKQRQRQRQRQRQKETKY